MIARQIDLPRAEKLRATVRIGTSVFQQSYVTECLVNLGSNNIHRLAVGRVGTHLVFSLAPDVGKPPTEGAPRFSPWGFYYGAIRPKVEFCRDVFQTSPRFIA